MRPFVPKDFFIFCPRYVVVIKPESPLHSLRISHFSTSSSTFQPSPPQSSWVTSRRHEEESRNVRVSVWWDFENCSPPLGANVFRIAQSITAAVRASGIKGSVQITAFGDVMQLSRANQEAMSATGVNLSHIPRGGKNSADRSLLVDLMYWVSQNPPPAHLFLISGDRDFAGVLHRLRMNNYNILLASPETAPSVLCSAASIMWQWNELVKGENLTGKYFNQPPDGPYGSWYGHYRVPLEDPFACNDKPSPASSAPAPVEEVTEGNSEPKPRPVPKAVVRQIRHILISYPNGVSITELRSELGKSTVGLDKDFYGFKKFSRFLLSMPNILKLQSGADGQFFVYGVVRKDSQSVDSTPSSATKPVTDEPASGLSRKLNSKGSSSSEGIDKKISSQPIPDINVIEPTKKSHESVKALQDPSLLPEKVDSASASERHSHPVDECNSSSEVGFFGRIWRKFFAGTDDGSVNKSSYLQENDSTSGKKTEVSKARKKLAKPTVQSASSVSPAPSATSSLSTQESVKNNKADMESDSYGDNSCPEQGLIDKFISRCKVWAWGSNLNPQTEKVNQPNFNSGKHEVFSRESFWKEMEVFLDTPPNGAALILQSKTREQMAQNLKKQGPLAVRSLEQSDLIHLVDLLITEKRWIKESPSQNYPFSLTRPAAKNSTLNSTANSNGLRSLFSSSHIHSEIDEEKKSQNLPHSGVSPPSITKSVAKSRNEILEDCQKLAEDVVKEQPEGFNMGGFRKQFLERYGYDLDIKALGYEKLATLLQIMPGVKVESTYIVPSNGSTENSDSDGLKKGDDSDSPWEELGPVANTGHHSQKGLDLKLRTKANEEAARPLSYDYEPLSIDDSSDSEDETPSLPRSEGKAGPRVNVEGSWNNIFGLIHDQSGKDSSGNGDNVLRSSSGTGSKPSDVLGAVTKSDIPMSYGGKKQPSKNISFVADPNEYKRKATMIDLLGTMENLGKSKIKS